MKTVIAICGASGTGKSTLVNYLTDMYPDEYNLVKSYTDRPKRNSNDLGHEFIDHATMIKLLNDKDNVVAKTRYGKHLYCSVVSQFCDNKKNLYVVDKQGLFDLANYQPPFFLRFIKIKREDVGDISEERKSRDIPIDDLLCDYVIENNGSIGELVESFREVVR